MEKRASHTKEKATPRWRSLVFLALLVWAPPAGAQDGTGLTAAERGEAIGQLVESSKKFLAAIAGLNERQWNFKPGPDRWSIAECAEHVTVAESGLMKLITEQIMNSPSEPEKKTQRQPDGAIRVALLNRSRKVQAPEMLLPTGRWKTRQQIEQVFGRLREQTIAYVRETKDDLRSHFGPNPVFGSLDGYQWMLYLSAHCERHVAQILEVKAEPGFPRD